MATTHLVVGPREKDNEKFGELLEDLRYKNKLTRAQAARTLGFSSEYLRLIETGKRTPPVGSMPHILETYGANDLVLYKTRIEFDEYSIRFTSRIREARGDGRANISVRTENRSESVGQIVALLVVADDRTLEKVYRILRKQQGEV